MAGLSLYDMSDPELLARVKDVSDQDGWVNTYDLGEALGFAEGDFTSVSIRMSWMKRYGVIEQDGKRVSLTITMNGKEEKRSFARWRLTDLGELAVNAKFSKPQQRLVEQLTDDQGWLLAQAYAERYERIDPVFAVLMRREAQYAFRKRRNGR